ncbi:MAG: conjugal transfer mating-pair stabilization protein TraG [Legionellaceae bacterium]|nr:conjugal transfer mating-pair stabilization protein TraG [Legionellaceae bacterium]
MITIHVLGFGELYQQLLNAVAAMMGQSLFSSFLKLTALMGIIMASVGYIKQRDPMIYAKWVMGYVLVMQLVITPKTMVEIYDISAQRSITVANVPVVFAVTASLITTVGVGLAESYDSLLSLPDDLTYTKTGSLFGSKIIQASRDFHILDPQLKAEMNEYLRNCVVGDIRLNHKYSVSDLSTSKNIWDLISKEASPLRRTSVNGESVTCQIAAGASGDYSLRTKLNAEIKKAYTFFGINLFSHASQSNYEKLLEMRLKSSFDYYQKMTDTSAGIFLQSMMINAIGDGIKDYQAFTDSTAGVVSNQVTKSQVQHRWSWAIMGQKAAWSLPILHTLLTVLLFGIFPVIIAMSTLPNGVAIFRGYLQFFISLQFWPVLFAILNAAMTMYGSAQSSQYGGITIVNIDKIDELHADLSGVAGYLMLMIPFLAKGLVSNLSDAFSNLATSMTGHLQGSAMSVANDAASASFSFGQTGFYNTNANSFSANKHDNNWTHMHGMHSEQLVTGVIKTHTAGGDTVFDVSPGMTKGALSMHSTDGLSGSLNEAHEATKQASSSAHQSFQSSVSNAAHKAIQLSRLQGHDMRLGHGVSESETGQYQEALSSMSHIASDVAKRTGVSTDEALIALTSAGINGRLKVPSMVTGAIRVATVGWADVGGSVSTSANRTSTSGDRAHDSFDAGVTAREAHDFNKAFSHVKHFVKNHHFDDSQSQGANLSNQMGSDLRHAEVASLNFDASLARSERISKAESYVKSQGDQITENWDQAFPAFVASRVGNDMRDQLFSHPGDRHSVQTLQGLSREFMQQERESIIARFGDSQQGEQVDNTYQQAAHDITIQSQSLDARYASSEDQLTHEAKDLGLGIKMSDKQAIEVNVNQKVTKSHDDIQHKKDVLQVSVNHLASDTARQLEIGWSNAKRGAVVPSFRNNDDKKEKS